MEKKQMEDSTQQEVETNQEPEHEQQKENIPCEEIKSQDDVPEQEEFTKKGKNSTDTRVTKLNALAKKYKYLLLAAPIIAIVVSGAISIWDRLDPPADSGNALSVSNNIENIYINYDPSLTVKDPGTSSLNKVIDEANRLRKDGKTEEAIKSGKTLLPKHGSILDISIRQTVDKKGTRCLRQINRSRIR